ncbi:MAG: nucleotidyltransferase domain-containing protein [Planctomycetes bacterium]|nr:nucleotidyltransferase domain-containing protein [Planctomycetota bacterium]
MIPAFNQNGDLPVGVYSATLAEIVGRFGQGSSQRRTVAGRLERVHQIAHATGHVARMIVFGSFVTDKDEPSDVDVVIIMEDAFDPDQLAGEGKILFDNAAAQSHSGASVFWIRRFAIFGDPQEFIEDWQFKRDRQRRGIVEIVGETS